MYKFTCLVKSVVHQPVDPGGERRGEGRGQEGMVGERRGWDGEKRREEKRGRDKMGGTGRERRRREGMEGNRGEGPSMYL